MRFCTKKFYKILFCQLELTVCVSREADSSLFFGGGGGIVCTGVYSSGQECRGIYSTDQECTGVYSTVQKCTGVYSTGQDTVCKVNDNVWCPPLRLRIDSR